MPIFRGIRSFFSEPYLKKTLKFGYFLLENFQYKIKSVLFKGGNNTPVSDHNFWTTDNKLFSGVFCKISSFETLGFRELITFYRIEKYWLFGILEVF